MRGAYLHPLLHLLTTSFIRVFLHSAGKRDIGKMHAQHEHCNKLFGNDLPKLKGARQYFSRSEKLLYEIYESDCSVGGSDWARRVDTDGRKWTRFDPRGSIGGIWGTNQNLMVPTNLVHIVVGPGKGTWDRKTKKTLTNRNIQHPASFGKNYLFFAKIPRPK